LDNPIGGGIATRSLVLNRLDETCHDSQLRVAPGDRLELVLRENPATGYRWGFEHKSGEVLVEVSDQFVAGKRPGEPGERIFLWEARSPGRVSLDLILSRAWAPEADAKHFRIVVDVTEQLPPNR
jgi:predicted secreted protein